MTHQTVVVGAGHAAGQLIASLKQKHYEGRIVLIGEEPHLPYQRPPLSKKFLAGDLPAERLLFKPPAFYDDESIDLRLDERVLSIDRTSQHVTTTLGETIHYDALVLATGSRVRRLDCDGADLQGIHYLRDIADVERIRQALSPNARVGIVGAGYIGLEVAAVCRSLGHATTVIEAADRVMSRVVSPAVSDFFERTHRERGVDLRLSTGLDGFDGEDGHVTAMRLDNGDRVAVDLVVVGIGIVPNQEIAEFAGIGADDGIVVDEQCRTSDPRVFAIGDCTRHPSRVYSKSLRLESVQNALEQAKVAADALTGGDDRYDQVPWFWSDQYEFKLQIAGLSDGYDEVVLRGQPDDGRFACAYLRQGRFIAIDCINLPKDFMQAKTLLSSTPVVDRDALADAGLSFKDIGDDLAQKEPCA